MMDHNAPKYVAVQYFRNKNFVVRIVEICEFLILMVSSPVTGPEGSRRFRLPDFHDIRQVKVVRLSASRTGRIYPQ
jgi:hypothetical protein